MPQPTRTIWTFSCGHEFDIKEYQRSAPNTSSTTSPPKTSSEPCPACRERYLQVTAQSYRKQEEIHRLKAVISVQGSHVGFLQHHINPGATEQDPDLASHFQKCLEDDTLMLAIKHKELLAAEHGSGEKTHPFLWASADGEEALDALKDRIEQICQAAQIEGFRANGSSSCSLNAWRQLEKETSKVIGDKKFATFEKNVDKVLEKVVELAEKDLVAVARTKDRR